jgi:glycosyltransferase involved in cell wall biosynthesis
MDAKVLKITRPFRSLLYRQIPGLFRLQRDLRLERRLEQWAASDIPTLHEARRLHEASYRNLNHPLVSVTIATYNRGRILTERTLPSVLQQTYQNFEIIVVGDACTDDTAERIAQLNDPRIRFHNLSERGEYPTEPSARHLVAGCDPANKALDLAQGYWIAHLDDDDIFTPDHIEALLDCAIHGDYELVHAKQQREVSPGAWIEIGRESFPTGRKPFGKACVPHRTLLFRAYLRFFKYSLEAWKYSFGADMLLWERMGRAGVRTGFLSQIVASKYLGTPVR